MSASKVVLAAVAAVATVAAVGFATLYFTSDSNEEAAPVPECQDRSYGHIASLVKYRVANPTAATVATAATAASTTLDALTCDLLPGLAANGRTAGRGQSGSTGITTPGLRPSSTALVTADVPKRSRTTSSAASRSSKRGSKESAS